MRKVILFELNEVPFRVIDDFCARNPRTTLATRLARCHQFVTHADHEILNPWITWPTVHRGVGDAQHGIHHLGQDASSIDREFPPLWRLLANRALNVGVFASLHSYPVPTNGQTYAFYVPDPFAPGPETLPARLSTFQQFNLAMSRRSARNVPGGIALQSGLSLLAESRALGLRAGTLARVGGQILSEQLKPWYRGRRRTFQTTLGFDVFMRELEGKRPDFCTFYTNHVASAMHRYWAATYPGDYSTSDFDEAWRERYGGEINFAMREFDRFFGRLASFVDRNPEYELWVVTSMGQAATSASRIQTQVYLTDAEQFMRALGLQPGEWSIRPAMAPQVAFFVDEGKRDTFRDGLKKLRIMGERFSFQQKGTFFSLDFGQIDLNDAAQVVVGEQPTSLTALGLSNVHIEDEAGSTGWHVPEGSLLIYPQASPAARPVTPVATTSIAPSILRHFAANVPGYMRPDAAFESQLAS